MIDLVYKTLQVIINKENNGYLSPDEFNKIAHITQSEIFRGYFPSENMSKNKDNRGYINKGYSNLDFNERQRIQQFSATMNVNVNTEGSFDLPDDLYFIEDDGIVPVDDNGAQSGNVIEETQRKIKGYLKNSMAASSVTYPTYERYANTIIVEPSTILRINIKYLRSPKKPTWTYFPLPTGIESFDPTNGSYQDFELHESEFSNIVIRMASYFGINLREGEVIQISESLKDKMNIKDNS